MFERIRCMIVKEFILVLRDPKARGVIFVTPLIQLMLFGYAVSTDVRNIRIAVQDFDNTPVTRELVSRFSQSGYFTVVGHIADEREAARLLDSEGARAVLRFDHGFGGEVEAGRTAQVQLLVDGADSNTARIAGDYAGRIVQAYTQDHLRAQYARMTGKTNLGDPVTLETRAWFNDNLESRNFYVPGVVASLLMLITLILTSMAVVREREVGTMEQIIATPITQLEFILGKSVPFALIGYVVATLITVVGVFWFGVPLRGSLLVLFLGVSLYLLSAVGAGLLISTVCGTQQQAMMTTFFFFMPFMLLSGFVFPIANMPPAVQWLTYLDPMRYILVVVRGVFLKGIGLDILWPQLVALLVLGVGTLAIATSRMKKTIT